jgi:hypothetical protein
MNETLQIIATLIAALWWGGLVTIDFIETPSRFRTPNVKRDAVFSIGRQVFRDFSYVQLVYGVLVIIVSVLGGAEIVIPLVALFMLILTALNVFLLEPALRQVREGVEEITEDTPEHARYQNLHRSYMVADIFKAVLGAILIGALVSA